MQVVESFESGKRIDGKFHIYVKVIVKRNGEYYIGKWPDRQQRPTEFSQLEDVKLIPTNNRGAVLRPHWTAAPDVDGYYIKKPSLEDYLDSELEARVEHEIEMCEFVKRFPHPNLAIYYGCLDVEGRVSELVFEKYETTLLEKVNPRRLSKRQFIVSGRLLVQDYMKHWLKSLQQALEHLHCLGFVHNDITPANIMLDRNNSPVIIDFGGLCRIGESLAFVKRTRGWHDESVIHALKENDINALVELETWLFGSVDDLIFTE
jgi:serine/threonine protein kinase